MYLEIEELKKTMPNTVNMAEYAKSLKQPTIVFRDYDEPTEPPFLQKGVKVFDAEKTPQPEVPYGTKPNVPGMNVINAITAALGAGGYALHISDGSYTGYTIWELNEFMKNFDNTDLRVWIAQVFDCDDFAQVLQGTVNSFFPGIAFGTIWYGPKDYSWGHAVNIFYSYTHNKVFLVEPQNDTFYEFNKTLWIPWMVIV
jgi:hypothetical protein